VLLRDLGPGLLLLLLLLLLPLSRKRPTRVVRNGIKVPQSERARRQMSPMSHAAALEPIPGTRGVLLQDLGPGLILLLLLTLSRKRPTRVVRNGIKVPTTRRKPEVNRGSGGIN
jgi:hypothetical protein